MYADAAVHISEALPLEISIDNFIDKNGGNKYIETPHGVFEIKFFFSSKIKSELTENHHSSISVKNTIKDIICNEVKILSDLDISNILSQKYSISISRRTVTKYREFMKIPTSATRKRLKKMGAS